MIENSQLPKICKGGNKISFWGCDIWAVIKTLVIMPPLYFHWGGEQVKKLPSPHGLWMHNKPFGIYYLLKINKINKGNLT